MHFVIQLKACAYWKGQESATANTRCDSNTFQNILSISKQNSFFLPFEWLDKKPVKYTTTPTERFSFNNNNKRWAESSHHLLAAIDAVQSLLQLGEGVALQALGSFLWDGRQRLPEQWLRGLREGLRGAAGLLLWLTRHLLEQKSQRGIWMFVWLQLIVLTLNVNIFKLPCSELQLPDSVPAAAPALYLEAERE